MQRLILLLISLAINFYLLHSNLNLEKDLEKVQNVEVSVVSASEYKCKEDTITTKIVTKTVKEIEYIEIPKIVEPDTPLPPDLKRLLDEAFSDLFPYAKTM